MDGKSLAHGERQMNTKRIAALVALGALLSTAAPAMAVTATGTVNVEWNYAVTATLVMYTQATASKTHAASSVTDIFWASDPAGSSTSQCNGTQSASADPDAGGAGGTINFGSVVSDSTDYTDCYEANAVDAYLTTNDSAGGNLTVVAAGNPTMPTDYDTAGNGGSLLCLIPTSTWSTTGNTAYAASAVVSNATVTLMNSTNSCSKGTAMTTTAATLLALTKSTTGSDLNADIELVLGPQLVSGQQNVNLNYTFTSN
jgi:hypothetical protein